MSSIRHLPALDGIRGLAIVAVMACHADAILKDVPHVSVLRYGTGGVDLFFVLSGYLITSILLREKERPGYFRNFYLRRACRIWPLYYLYLAVMFAMVAVLPHLSFWQHFAAQSDSLRGNPLVITTPVVICLLLAQNLWRPSLWGAHDQISITWSLCIEEQFYLFWPLVIRWLSPRKARYILLALIASQPVLRALVLYSHADPSFKWQTVTRIPLFHFDGIAAGSLLALYWPEVKDHPKLRPVLWSTLLVSIPLGLLCFSETNPFGYTAAMLFSVSLVGLGLLGFGKTILTAAPLVFMGEISYGLYLIHPAIFEFLQSHGLYRRLGLHGNLLGTEFVALAAAAVVSIGLATLSRFTFEAYFLGLKNRRSNVREKARVAA